MEKSFTPSSHNFLYVSLLAEPLVDIAIRFISRYFESFTSSKIPG